MTRIREHVPTEAQEAADLARALKRAGLCFTHVPSGGLRTGRGGAVLARTGVVPGCPDFLVFDPVPPHVHGKLDDGHGGTLRERARGVAVELKRARGGRVSAAQREFHARLAQCGWLVLVAHGAEDAVRQLRALGLPV